MYLPSLVAIFAIICISTHIHSIQSQAPPPVPARYSKWGLGPCPNVTGMEGFDMTKAYGDWYVVAHYAESPMFGRHCTKARFTDANPGGDICRVNVNRNSTEYDDGEVVEAYFELLFPEENDQSRWVDTFHANNAFMITTDYDKYLAKHECYSYPRDNPIMYEQHNYIRSRRKNWPGQLEDFQEVLDVFASFGIDTAPFAWHNWDDCKE